MARVFAVQVQNLIELYAYRGTKLVAGRVLSPVTGLVKGTGAVRVLSPVTNLSG